MNKFENDCLKFLLKMVSTKSLSKNEGAVSEIVAKEMRELKYDAVKIDKLGSVIGKIGTGKIKILFDAHIDTVGIADIKQWKTDPFKAVYKNGIVYGRGSCDDKGCVASMVYAGGLIKKLGLLDDFTLYVSASVQEEIADGYGIDFLLKSLKFRPDCVVIGEPSNLKIVRGHKGRAEIKITVKGKACHASIPHQGENAIYKTIPLIKNIDALNKKYKITSQLGKPVISVTQIETKNASINTIPDNCSIYIDRRTVENETKKQIEIEIKKACGKNVKIEYLKKFFNAWILPREHYLVKSAVKSYKKAYKKDSKVVLWPFCTNGSFTMGERKIPTIGFGPGEEKFAHVANEHLRFNDVLAAVKFYSVFPLTFSSKKI
ncbi:MAG: YgeY family selenium metabolism-linked hydrolase [Elusimicrobia bacterium HGW-Elusimicrobia-4]|nr:MAG: YgeY family selenium metabolism-linked hydrolase [Elusimicrobia bacterium HGW-Elusimicrobia-4]